LVAAAGCEKATKLLPPLILSGDALGGFEVLRPPLRGNRRGQVSQLLCL
jgi:hypothetical protein